VIDLPALDKQLLLAFESGLLSVSGLPCSRSVSKTVRVPRLFRGLWTRLFDNAGCLRDDIDPNVVFFLRTLLCATKKMLLGCAPKYLFKATKEFYDVDIRLPMASPLWDGDLDDVMSVHAVVNSKHLLDVASEGLFPSGTEDLRRMLGFVQRVADQTSVELGLYEPHATRFRHGPGVVSDIPSRDYKFEFRKWGNRLEHVLPWAEWGTTPLGLVDRLQSNGLAVSFIELASRLIAVPKTATTPRLIAAEPSSHQWAQQSVRDFLYSRIAATNPGRSIDFGRQDLSGLMALEASKSGRYATIDLSSASDRISCWLVERLFRRNPQLLLYMSAMRTRFITNDIDDAIPKLIKLRKFSTMGSALTFPIQSLVFYMICVGVGLALNPHSSIGDLARQVRVYGDDLIIPVFWEPKVREVLTSLFLKVNDAKTFTKGNFRESCGVDAFGGYDVTPARIGLSDLEPRSKLLPSRVASSNNLYKKGLWIAAAWLASTVPLRHLVPVVAKGASTFGFISYGNLGSGPPGKETWDSKLHYWTRNVVQPLARQRIMKQDTAACLLQYFTQMGEGEDPEGSSGAPGSYIDYESGVAVAGDPVIRFTRASRESMGYNA